MSLELVERLELSRTEQAAVGYGVGELKFYFDLGRGRFLERFNQPLSCAEQSHL